MRFAKKNIIFNKTHVIRRLKHVFDFSIKLLSLSFSLKYEFKFRISVEGDALNYRPMITPKFIFHKFEATLQSDKFRAHGTSSISLQESSVHEFFGRQLSSTSLLPIIIRLNNPCVCVCVYIYIYTYMYRFWDFVTHQRLMSYFYMARSSPGNFMQLGNMTENNSIHV
jgi:hypothetical protein